PQAMTRAVKKGQEQGLEWWTARQINDWERARLSVRWGVGDDNSITIQSKATMEDATILWLDSSPDELESSRFNAWGFAFVAATTTLPRGISLLPAREKT